MIRHQLASELLVGVGKSPSSPCWYVLSKWFMTNEGVFARFLHDETPLPPIFYTVLFGKRLPSASYIEGVKE